MKIYTRTGDKGKTSLADGIRVSKASGRVEAYGTVDELNSFIGVAISQLMPSEQQVKRELETIQDDLFTIGSGLASPGVKSPHFAKASGGEQELRIKSLELRVKEFEVLIDELTKELPELKNFILPGGGKAGSMLHVARTVCRRAERFLVALSQKEKVDDRILVYFNRLSDLLFTMARFVNMKEKKKETIWSS